MLNPPSSDPFVLARSLVTRLMLANLGHETKAKPFAEIIQLVLIRLTRSLNELNANDANTKDAVAAAHALSVCVAIRKGKRVDGASLVALHCEPLTLLYSQIPSRAPCFRHWRPSPLLYDGWKAHYAAHSSSCLSFLFPPAAFRIR